MLAPEINAIRYCAKLIEKVAENILSALKNPKEAILSLQRSMAWFLIELARTVSPLGS